MIDTVFFDLDGTLLPMDQDKYVNTYLDLMAVKMEPQGYDPMQLIAAIWSGCWAIAENDGTATNEEVFWQTFCGIFGADARKDEPLLLEFYATDFNLARAVCGFAPEAAEVIGLLKERGVDRVLATAPVFPAIATRQRIRWAGLKLEDFSLITTYENSHYAKPSPEYYREILQKLGKKPENCLMVGNDVAEDMVPAAAVGMQVFLLTPCIINRKGLDTTRYPQGGFEELKDFLLKQLQNAGAEV